MLVEMVGLLHEPLTEYAHCIGLVCDSFIDREPS